MTSASAGIAVAERAGDDWKHVSPDDFLLDGSEIGPAEAAALAARHALPEAWARLVFVGGAFRQDLSQLPEATGAWSVEPASAMVPQEIATTLSVHRLLRKHPEAGTEGALLRVAGGAILPGPVQILEIASGSSWLLHRARLGAGADATVLETHVSADGATTSTRSVFEADLPAGARLRHVRVQLEDEGTRVWSALAARQHADSVLEARHVALGGGIARCEIHADLAGSGAKLVVEGLSASCGQSRQDALTSVHHRVRDCSSDQTWKSLARDRSVGSFTGGILVARGADGTAAMQSSRNILLSREAAIHSLPKLRIFADDVKCSHGSATGKLDEKALFFLRSRGLSALDARKVLVKAFADEILGRIPWESLRVALEERLGGRI
jgi:Fe-S cluster assembly protein SufD